MKFLNFEDIINVLIALLLFAVIERLFLGDALDGLADKVGGGAGNFEVDEEDEF